MRSPSLEVYTALQTKVWAPSSCHRQKVDGRFSFAWCLCEQVGAQVVAAEAIGGETRGLRRSVCVQGVGGGDKIEGRRLRNARADEMTRAKTIGWKHLDIMGDNEVVSASREKDWERRGAVVVQHRLLTLRLHFRLMQCAAQTRLGQGPQGEEGDRDRTLSVTELTGSSE